MTAVDEVRVGWGGIVFPPEVDESAVLRPLRHGAWLLPGCGRCGAATPCEVGCGAAYRRAVTRTSPARFALTYLAPYLRHGERIELTPMHIELCYLLQQWIVPGPHRDAVVAPRRSGKSTWLRLIGPLWALAHGHRRFLQSFSLTDRQAAGHLARLLDVLHGRGAEGVACGPLLLADFPELVPVRGAGGPGRTVLAGGGVIGSRGLGANTRGEVVGASRPDLLVGDDVLPNAGRITADAVAQVKDMIRNDMLPMNDEAAAVLSGTVVMDGDAMDDVVRLARGETPRGPDRGRWLTAERFTCHYFRPDWPSRWPVAELAAKRAADPRTYALQFEPHLLGTEETSKYWTPSTWQYGFGFLVGRRVVSVDEAYSKKAGADHTALAVLAVDTSGLRICVEHVEQGRYSLAEKRDRIAELYRWSGRLGGPAADVVLIEAVRDGEGAVEALAPFPPGLVPVPYAVRARKAERIEVLHRRYLERVIWHRARLVDYEAQAESWSPRSTTDDMLDVVAGAVRFLLTGSAAA